MDNFISRKELEQFLKSKLEDSIFLDASIYDLATWMSDEFDLDLTDDSELEDKDTDIDGVEQDEFY
jgi:hypothetical protein